MPNPPADEAETGWHLDKKVPISLIIAILAQMAGGLWFASKLDARLERLEAARVEQHDRDERQDRSSADAVGLLRSDIRDVANKLDRLIERREK